MLNGVLSQSPFAQNCEPFKGLEYVMCIAAKHRSQITAKVFENLEDPHIRSQTLKIAGFAGVAIAAITFGPSLETTLDCIKGAAPYLTLAGRIVITSFLR